MSALVQKLQEVMDDRPKTFLEQAAAQLRYLAIRSLLGALTEEEKELPPRELTPKLKTILQRQYQVESVVETYVPILTAILASIPETKTRNKESVRHLMVVPDPLKDSPHLRNLPLGKGRKFYFSLPSEVTVEEVQQIIKHLQSFVPEEKE